MLKATEANLIIMAIIIGGTTISGDLGYLMFLPFFMLTYAVAKWG